MNISNSESPCKHKLRPALCRIYQAVLSSKKKSNIPSNMHIKWLNESAGDPVGGVQTDPSHDHLLHKSWIMEKLVLWPSFDAKLA